MTKTVLITGASRGIGKACALKLAEDYDNIIINSLNNINSLNETKHVINSMGRNCLSFTGDVGNHTFVKDMISQSMEKFDHIDCLINNAGISYVGLLTDMNIEQWNKIISTNLTSVFNCCHQVIPDMVKQKKGKIINISSMWGLSGASCEVAYSATKGAINAFTMALAKELAPSNIQVNAIACGAINTDMNSCFSEDELINFCEGIPTGRLGTTDEIAKTVQFLCNAPEYLTGEIIKIDGGYL